MPVRMPFFQLLLAMVLTTGWLATLTVAARAQSTEPVDPFARDLERDEDDDLDAEDEDAAGTQGTGRSDNNSERGLGDGETPRIDDQDLFTAEQIRREAQRQADDRLLGDESRLLQDRETEPYEPLGIRIGSFILYPEFEAARTHTDNVFTSANTTRSDWSTELLPSLEIQSDWSRHEFTGLFEFEKELFDEFTSEDEENILASLRGRLDISRRTSLTGEAAYQSETQSRSDVNVPNNVAVRPTETTSSGAVELEHAFNRLTLNLRGEVTEEEFEDVSLAGGGTFDNAARDNTEKQLIGRMTYELMPGVALYAEGRGNEIELARPSAGGVRLDSNGWAALGGLSLDYGGTITGEIGAGFAQQLPDNGTLQGIEGAILAANIIWALNALTEIRFNAQFDVETTILTDSIGSLVRTYGIEVEHSFRENLIVTAAVEFETEDFASANLEEERLEVGIEGEYLLNRSVGLLAGYEFTDFNSSNSTNDYQENLFRLGIRLRR